MPPIINVPRLVTTPKVSVSMQHVRDGINGKASVLKGLGGNSLKSMSLDKVAALSDGAKEEALSTGVIGATGFGTGVLGQSLLGNSTFRKLTSRLGTKTKAGLAVGGLGLIGDYGAVKAIRAISGPSTVKHEVKNMNKVANYQRNQLVGKALAYSMLKQAETSDATYALMNGAEALENRIATQYGAAGPAGFKDKLKSNAKGNLRATGRGYLEAIPAAAIGATAGHLLTKAFGGHAMGNTLGGAMLGALPAVLHGQHASFANQAKEMHKKYAPAEKQAAFNELVDSGFDFDSAVNAVLSVL